MRKPKPERSVMSSTTTHFALVLVAISILVITFSVLSGALLPTNKGDVAKFYLRNSLDKVTSANAVNAIIWEFRGYDTLGEELVLITASLSVFVLLYKRKR